MVNGWLASASLLTCALLGGCTADAPAPRVDAASVAEAPAAAPTLRVEVDGHAQRWTTATLAAALAGRETTVEVDSPVYHRPMRYVGYPLADVLRATRADGLTGELEFHCADGFVPTLPAALVESLGLFLAVGEPAAPDGRRWTPLPKDPSASPGPFYVIGTAPGAYARFPWPYQLTAIRAVDFAATYPDAYPRGAEPDSPVYRGFATFRSLCFGCHSINLQGGDLGPELNIPRSVTEYRDRATLRAFIRDPRAFRARTRMPTLALDDGQLDDLLSYLDHMAGLEKPPTPAAR